jgi:hypothetical protein
VTRPFIVASTDAAIETLRQVGFARRQGLDWHFQRCDFSSPLSDVAFLRQNDWQNNFGNSADALAPYGSIPDDGPSSH